MTEKWRATFNGTPSAPVIANGTVYISDVDAHTVHALDAVTGESIWKHTAGARVDTPPTYYTGLVLFGCRDGWVTCLRARDGALAWKEAGLPMCFVRAEAIDRVSQETHLGWNLPRHPHAAGGRLDVGGVLRGVRR